MDSTLTFGLAFTTVIGTGLMAGLFFVFSTFMMRVLAELPGTQGMEVMRSINRTILTPLFLLVFMGTTAACAVLGGVTVLAVDGPARPYLIAGCLLYLVGVFVLTAAYHVPRNVALDTADPLSAEGARLWAGYVRNWTAWNHVRTLASVGALASLAMAIRAG